MGESEGLLHSIFENVPVGLLIKSHDHIVERANNTYLSWYGFDADTIAGYRSDEIEDFQSAEEATFMNAQEREVLSTGKIQTRQVERPFADGKIHTINIIKFPIYDLQGDITKVGSVSIDLTEQVQARKALSESEKRHRDFAADVAHELRTPLTLLKLQLDEMEDSDLARTLQQEVNSMTRLVEQLLALARMDMLDINPEDEADLHAVCTNVAMQLAPIAFNEGLFIEMVGANGPVKVPGNHDALEQAVRNLVENAIKFSDRGTTITIDLGLNGSVRVIDQGIGVSKDKREEIFERFLRSDRKEDGSGLGLSIVRRTMEVHGGTVQVGDAPGGGAVFTISFTNAAE